MPRGKKREKPNLSFLSVARLLDKKPEEWSESDKRVFKGFLESLVPAIARLPTRCQQGDPDALYFVLHREQQRFRRIDGELKPDTQILLPNWLVEALLGYLMRQWAGGRRGEKGRRSIDKRSRDALVHYLRYSAVEECRAEGLTLLEAYSEAAERLPGDPASGTADTFHRSHTKVTKELRKNPDAYHLPLMIAAQWWSSHKQDEDSAAEE